MRLDEKIYKLAEAVHAAELEIEKLHAATVWLVKQHQQDRLEIAKLKRAIVMMVQAKKIYNGQRG
jgi:hypothetical protein